MNGLALCAGIGGLELGLHIALDGYRTVGYVERDACAAGCLVARMADAGLDEAPVWDDIKTFDGGPWRGVVDIITAGYPCQPFSVAGKRAGVRDPRHLWPDIAKVVADVRPEWCFFENVAGHLVLGFDTVYEELEGLGYDVEAALVSAESVGASHKRERLFILAHSKGEQSDEVYAEQVGGPAAESRDSRGELAHAECVQPRQPEGGITEQRGRATDGSEAVADATSGTMQGQWSGGVEVAEVHAGADVPQCDGIGVFPPGPGELDRWAEVLEADPTLEPAIRGVADGLFSRVDRLRLLGNAVVPVCAAVAFVHLVARFGD